MVEVFRGKKKRELNEFSGSFTLAKKIFVRLNTKPKIFYTDAPTCRICDDIPVNLRHL